RYSLDISTKIEVCPSVKLLLLASLRDPQPKPQSVERIELPCTRITDILPRKSARAAVVRIKLRIQIPAVREVHLEACIASDLFLWVEAPGKRSTITTPLVGAVIVGRIAHPFFVCRKFGAVEVQIGHHRPLAPRWRNSP